MLDGAGDCGYIDCDGVGVIGAAGVDGLLELLNPTKLASWFCWLWSIFVLELESSEDNTAAI